MAIQFRKSQKVGPFRFTLSNRGFSTSVGAGPLRISRGADGRVRRTVRVPGVGLYDTRVIGQSRRQTSDKATATTRLATAVADVASPSGGAYPDGTEQGSSSAKPPPVGNRSLIVGASIVCAILLLILLGNCGGNKQDSVGATVTKTVTTTAQPPTVTVTAQSPTVTVTAEPSTSVVTVTEAAPPPAFFDPPETSTFEAAPPLTSSVYYANCSEARAAGAAPLLAGEPGYRSGLDRDNDGVACES